MRWFKWNRKLQETISFLNALIQKADMEGVLVNFRGSRRTKSDNQMVLKINSFENKEKARSLVGRAVVWKSPAGRVIKGKITNIHGNTGALRVMFEKGMPGQSISQRVSVE